MYGKPAMTCFKYQVYCTGRVKSHPIFECYILSGYRASTTSHQTAPPTTTDRPSPSVSQSNLCPLGRELQYGMVKLPT
jgi:hypothetical protein